MNLRERKIRGKKITKNRERNLNVDGCRDVITGWLHSDALRYTACAAGIPPRAAKCWYSTCIYIYIYLYIRIYICIYLYKSVSVYICGTALVYMCSDIDIYLHTDTYIYYLHTYIYIYIHIHMFVCTRIHVQIKTCSTYIYV